MLPLWPGAGQPIQAPGQQQKAGSRAYTVRAMHLPSHRSVLLAALLATPVVAQDISPELVDDPGLEAPPKPPIENLITVDGAGLALFAMTGSFDPLGAGFDAPYLTAEYERTINRFLTLFVAGHYKGRSFPSVVEISAFHVGFGARWYLLLSAPTGLFLGGEVGVGTFHRKFLFDEAINEPPNDGSMIAVSFMAGYGLVLFEHLALAAEAGVSAFAALTLGTPPPIAPLVRIKVGVAF